jgi:two-component system sensor histidine kinase KdpD
VPLDYVEIDEVLSNLIENAIRHTPAGTHIDVSAAVTEGDAIIEVSDDGPGIPPEAMPRLFDPFVRIASAQRGTRGIGLGLAVARGLVEAHGGRIEARPRSGGGAVFRVTLPLEISNR